MANDSPLPPRSDNAFHLVQGIRERLETSALDGLIVLVDACETEQGVRGAAHRWTGPLAHSAGRMELLVAAGDGPAYAGCFTRTILSTFGSGLPLRGENLLPYDLVDPIARDCLLQQPLHLSFTAGTVSASSGGDAGLWLVPNVARRRDALTGRPAAGHVDQLTRRLLLTDTMRVCLADVIDASGQRLRAVVGPAGCGKSTLMATLIRPSVVDGLPIASEYVTAAVFLTVSSSLESVAEELSEQLAERVPGYAEACRLARRRADAAGFDVFDICIRQPLAEVARPGIRITLLLDGLDQPEAGSRKLLVAGVAELTRRDDLRHVRVIAGIRRGSDTDHNPDLAHMYRIELPQPTAADIDALVQAGWRDLLPYGPAPAPEGPAPDGDWDEEPDEELNIAAGGWLLARLQGEVNPIVIGRPTVVTGDLETIVAERIQTAIYTTTSDIAAAIGPLLAILVAAGAGPVLPVELLDDAMSSFREDLSAVRIRDVTVSLGSLITRSRPGTAQESLGIAHNSLLPELTSAFAWLDVDIEDAHRAIISATLRHTSTAAAEYARGSTPRHYLACGDSGRALAFIAALETPRTADNRDLWSAWLPSIVAAVGSDHPDALQAREYLATRRAESGDPRGAFAEYARLLDIQLEILGPDHPGTLRTRHNLAVCLGESGDLAGAVADFAEVLADRERVLGPEDQDSKASRKELAQWRSKRDAQRSP
ncbi:tetratricopeptide repeat protein [Nocardia colli]|uniref:Tetratricopeptide repeat protein n=2 Tax=Nocardia colli TaxID=2545717 RepID=A0A5N0EKA0_9NOCA|nr:tetratricopeptide repeat protein [Nocardia colli]